jgi:hypothetical protein
MTPSKRPPPPSPVRQGAPNRPPAQPRAEGTAAKGETSFPLLLWGGIAAGLLGMLLIGVVIFVVTRPPQPEVVVAPELNNNSPLVPEPENAATENAEIKKTGTENITPPLETGETNPQLPVPPLDPSAPASTATTPPATTPQPAPMPMAIPTGSNPGPTPPMVATTIPSPAPATTPQAPASTGTALDDVRARGKLLQIPESKDTSRRVLTMVQVGQPQDCDLTLLGTEEICPAGSTLQLVKQDPTADERVWSVTLKSAGALSKARTIADFRLKGAELSFQWQKLSGVLPALMFCLLRIDAAGEQELCQLCKPLTAHALPLKLADRWTIEAELPADAGSTPLPIRAEPLAIDFPNVSQPGNTTIAAGQTAILKVSGQSTGNLDVELELECKFELKQGKLQLVIVPYSTPPNPARGERAPQRVVVSLATIKQRKTEQTKLANRLESQVKSLKSELDRIERDERSLLGVVPMNVSQRNALAQQQLQLRQKLAVLQPSLDEAETQHENITDAAAWHSDMLALLEQLETQAKVGLRLFRSVGNERVVIAEPPSSP